MASMLALGLPRAPSGSSRGCCRGCGPGATAEGQKEPAGAGDLHPGLLPGGGRGCDQLERAAAPRRCRTGRLDGSHGKELPPPASAGKNRAQPGRTAAAGDGQDPRALGTAEGHSRGRRGGLEGHPGVPALAASRATCPTPCAHGMAAASRGSCWAPTPQPAPQSPVWGTALPGAAAQQHGGDTSPRPFPSLRGRFPARGLEEEKGQRPPAPTGPGSRGVTQGSPHQQWGHPGTPSPAPLPGCADAAITPSAGQGSASLPSRGAQPLSNHWKG